MPSRRSVVLAVAASAIAGLAPLATFAHADSALPPDYPAAGCFDLTDPAGDTSGIGGTLSDDDLDMTGIAFEKTDTSLLAYLRVPLLTNDPMSREPFDGHRFTLEFHFNSHKFDASGSDYASGSGDAGSGAFRDGLAQTGEAAHVTQLAVDGASSLNLTNPDPAWVTGRGYVDSGLKVGFDYTHGFVIFDLPISDILKYGKADDFSGTLTGVYASSQEDAYAVGEPFDSAPDTDTNGNGVGTWNIGENKCFGPPAAVLTNTGATKVQYTDSAAVGAKLTDASGAPLAGQAVTFALGKLQTTATTNSKGVATAKLTPTVTAGSYTLTTSFAGTDGARAASISTPFTVTVEKTVTSLAERSSGAKRIITATVKDDDKHAVAGQKLSWLVNGKAAGTAATSKTGVASITVAKGQTVKAVFAAVKGKYAASSASRKA